jgi:SAM-dependent methyltransferase
VSNRLTDALTHLGPKLYRELAQWYPVFSSPEDCRAEAARFMRALAKAADRAPREVLELGSGAGNIASHFKQRYAMTLIDLSPQMLAVSKALNPECEHVKADIRTVRLGRTFDAVFVQDAICHMTTEADLLAVLKTAYAHLRPGGVAMFVPDDVRETFVGSTDHGGNDAKRGSVRFLQWTSDPDPRDTTYLVDFAIFIRDGDGRTRLVHDRHTYGLFPRAKWRASLRQVGFKLNPINRADFGRDVFLAHRPS